MTEAQKQKMQSARAVTMEAQKDRRAQVLRVGEWEVLYADADNWMLRKGETGEPRYYPTQAYALKALLHERIGDAQSKTIAAVLKAVAHAEAEIVAAVS